MTLDIARTSSKVYAKRTTLTSTTVPVALAASTVVLTECVIQADPSNTVNVLIGDATSQIYVLEPRQEFVCSVGNPSLIFAKLETGTVDVTTAIVNLFGRYGE